MKMIARRQCAGVSVAGVTLSFILLIHSAFALSDKSSSLHNQFDVLDIADSMRRARQVFSPNIAREKELQPLNILNAGNSSSSVFSLTLHPRSTLDHKNYSNYTSLVLSRLSRDAARWQSIVRKHSLALSGASRFKAASRPKKLKAPLTSGVGRGTGEYFASIGVGRPAQKAYMIIDTGSDVTWLQCQPCYDCYEQTYPIYDPSASSTYKALSCSSQQCKSLDASDCDSGTCLYEVSYGDGSFTVGNLATETISFGSSGSADKLAVGCGQDNEGLFVAANGLMGLGGGALSLPSQIKASSFSYCLVNSDSSSSSTLEFNSAAPRDSVFARPLMNPYIKTYKYVDLTGIMVNGQRVRLPSSIFKIRNGEGGVIVDSGTTVTRWPTQVYNALRDAFKKQSKLPPAGGFSLFDTCFDLSSMERAEVPTVALVFSTGKPLPLPPNNILIQVDDAGTFCLAFAPTSSSLSIIGNIQQQGMRVSYNLADKTIGFSLNKC